MSRPSRFGSDDSKRTDMKLSDRLYQEVDDSCALCGARGVDVLTIHHIDGNSSNNVYENTIVLCHNCHTRYHDEKGITASHIRERKRHLIQKTVTTYGLNALKIAARNRIGVVTMPFLLYHVVELGYMVKKEEVMGYDVENGNINDALARFSITEGGDALLKDWFEG